MWGALSPVTHYLRKVVRSVAEGWNAFWHTPADPTLLGLIRVLTGLMLLYTHAVWGLALNDFFGPASWLRPRLVRLHPARSSHAIHSGGGCRPGRCGQPMPYPCSILTLFTIGLWTRVTSFLSLCVVISFANRVPAAFFGLDQINRMLTLYLTSDRVARRCRWTAGWRCGGSDPTLPPPDAERIANLALRLIQVHMCVIYFFAGISKLQGPSWWTGEAMWRAFANLEYQSLDMTWLAWHPWLVNLMTHVSVLWEISFCVLIWKPLWRPIMLAGAVVLHVGIGAFLGMWTFGLVMLVGCASFLPVEEVRRLLTRRPAERIAIPEAMDASPPPRRRGPDRAGRRTLKSSGIAMSVDNADNFGTMVHSLFVKAASVRRGPPDHARPRSWFERGVSRPAGVPDRRSRYKQ